MMNPQARRVERNRDEVRRLSQKDGNRYCMDCGMRGPLYVVTNFRIFVCSTCAAMHRSLQHKVKGISMTEFSDEEVAGLTVGGNDRAARVWLARYKKSRPQPGSNIAVKDFIITVFEDMAYADRDEFDRFQSDLLRGITAEPPRVSSLTAPPPPQQQRQQPQHTRAGPLPAESPHVSSLGTRGALNPPPPVTSSSSSQQQQLDFFGQPVAARCPEPITNSASAVPTDDDLFTDFFTAVAPPPAPAPAVAAAVPSAPANAPITPESFTDWFTSAPTAHPQFNVGAPTGTVVSAPQPTPQPSFFPPAGQLQYPPTMLPQHGFQSHPGINPGVYNFMVQDDLPLQQQQQQQQCLTGFSTDVPAGPNVAPYQIPTTTQAQQPFVSSAGLPNMNSMNFFQEPPLDPWSGSKVPEPTKASPIKPTNEPRGDAFASLGPFGGKW